MTESPDESALLALARATLKAKEQNESVQLWKEQAFHWEKRCAQQMTDLANARYQADEGNALFNGIVGILGAPPATVTTTAAFIEWVRAELARLKAAMEELRAQIEPCGCKLGRCEQFPDKELLYYGRLCRDRAALDALKGTSP